MSVDLDSGEAGGHGRERVIHCTGDLGGIGAGEAFDDEHQPGGTVQAGVTYQWLVVLGHACHVTNAQGRGLGALNRYVG